MHWSCQNSSMGLGPGHHWRPLHWKSSELQLRGWWEGFLGVARIFLPTQPRRLLFYRLDFWSRKPILLWNVYASQLACTSMVGRSFTNSYLSKKGPVKILGCRDYMMRSNGTTRSCSPKTRSQVPLMSWLSTGIAARSIGRGNCAS